MTTVKKTDKRGGPRPNSGPQKGSGTQVKISVSVSKKNWQAAMKRWQKKGSWLVDKLLSDFLYRSREVAS